ncbi:polyisoprenoid diphosphate/phosphate phosphohydrolase PLPP6 isoform X1 [Hylaeus anthracinus]|uniref:polyisoprenoid diphosphate/phosphate phosphohydrolase PLPP6 isoform X1 n=2 Tax=Hylaeus anthracinus TaxID=313031 RepID=UPI0023B9B7E1|nr:polyisoprenoid diphosphate/phosphate phosphohydrolase PLPP6 isoform X1 [Hylaeus anthracinus]
MDKNKREIPKVIKDLLVFDIKFSHNLVTQAEKFNFMKQLRVHYTVLEISCHGIPWIASILALIWILDNKSLYQVQVNLLIGLLLDIIVIALLKSVTRRRRPSVSPVPFAVGPDKYSFPSGHASRAMLVFYFFKYLWPVSVLFLTPILAWVVAVSLSRLLMRRHHVLDIIVGLFVGYAEGLFMSLMYLEPETCYNLVYWLTDEKLSGAEYDI